MITKLCRNRPKSQSWAELVRTMAGFGNVSQPAGLPLLVLAGLLAVSSAAARNQYIGYVYPAGGRQGTTFSVKIGGQRLDHVHDAIVSGEGVSARVAMHYERMNNRHRQMLRDQLKELKKGESELNEPMVAKMSSFDFPAPIGPEEESRAGRKNAKDSAKGPAKSNVEKARRKLIERIERKLAADQRRPASRSLCELVFLEVTIASDAKPGRREIRLVTKKGASNALPFYVGQVPEVARKAMEISRQQVLGNEQASQRNRPAEEEEMRVTLPCTMNGQVASGEVNRYRFKAQKGQRLVISAKARQLVPYIADAVPGWFQAVLTLRDAEGNEVAYNDDFRFHPDPTISFEVPQDGEYVLGIHDAIYRGREDFVYRITISELPFLTGIFPLGARVGEPATMEENGWNLDGANLRPPAANAEPGTHLVTAVRGSFVSNSVPFSLGTLPECLDQESNNNPSDGQKLEPPIVVNGRVDEQDDWDVFQIDGSAGDTLVAEVHARRLNSPLDSFLKITNSSGKTLALNDDHQDAAVGLNTNHADSYLMLKLPADGTYFVHLGDTTRHGGKSHAYRLRISPPRPDFELRVVNSRINIRGKKAAAVTVYAIRRDGFDGPIRLSVKNLPDGLQSPGATIGAGKNKSRLAVKTTLKAMEDPVDVSVVGKAKIQGSDVVREAVPAEDRMQAFLWRHLLPAEDLMTLVYDPSYKLPQKRKRPSASEKDDSDSKSKPEFSKGQVAGRLRQIEELYQRWLITDDFANRLIEETTGGG